MKTQLLIISCVCALSLPAFAQGGRRSAPVRLKAATFTLHRPADARAGVKRYSMGSGMALADARSRAIVYTPNGSGGYQYHDSLTGQRLVHCGGAPGVFYPVQNPAPAQTQTQPQTQTPTPSPTPTPGQ
jgi:hypothetical protein